MKTEEVKFGYYVWYASVPEPRVFYQVGGKQLERFEVLTDIFNRILVPLYGSQEKALAQIKESIDRRAYLLYEGNTPAGVLVFKTVLSNEYSKFGVKDSIEIKSLFVDNSVENSGRGLGSALIDKLKSEVDQLHLNHKGIHVTVSETKQESLAFFRRKGFQVAFELKGWYQEGVVEYLLSCPAKIEESADANIPLQQKFKLFWERSANYRSMGSSPELIHVITHAHFDDIHALKKLSDGTFISGSKDNSINKWSPDGNLVKVIQEVEPTSRTQRDWITAATVLNDGYWLSGERNGRVHLWKTNGDHVKTIQLVRPSADSHVSLRENAKRVNCLSSGLNSNAPTFFVGFPTLFDEYNLLEGKTTSMTKVHDNDWVYDIKPLDPNRLLIATGCTVDLWEKNQEGWYRGTQFIKEGRKVLGSNGKMQRPFVSSITPLRNSGNLLGVASFDGSVKVVDMQRNKIINLWREHNHRVWMIENISDTMFVTSGEDRCIKFWDLRQNQSVHTIADHVGQVSSLLSYNENLLLAATSPENPLASENGAEIRFYDIRK